MDDFDFDEKVKREDKKKKEEWENSLMMSAGCLVAFSTGEYSDYGYSGTFVALQNVTRKQVMDLSKEVNSSADNDEDNYPDRHSMFIAACIRNGWLICVDMTEIHIGSYGELTPC